MNKRLTKEDATKLKYPCLLEVWDNEQRKTKYPTYKIVIGISVNGERFIDLSNFYWDNAALPSPEIAEAMRKQFAPESEYPKRMLVWDGNEEKAEPRIVLADLGENCKGRYIVVMRNYETEFENEEVFNWTYYRNAKPIPEPDPIAQEIAELRQRLADLEAKHNQ